eukprot:4501996-Pleurochrysis_carterae.AAC.1
MSSQPLPSPPFCVIHALPRATLATEVSHRCGHLMRERHAPTPPLPPRPLPPYYRRPRYRQLRR